MNFDTTEKSFFFEKIEIQGCNRKDREIIIKKLLPQQESVSSAICFAIKSSSAQVEDLLKTPLLISILVTKYLVNREIPASQYDFYRDIFDVLAQRHDRLKIGIDRGFRSGLSVSKLQECFEMICVETKKRKIISFDAIVMSELVGISIESLELKANVDKVTHDLTKNICLIVRDGLGYSFVHKSIQEFFFASYIAKCEVDLENIFLSLSDSYKDYMVEIGFLEYIESYKWSKYFVLPVFEVGFSDFGFFNYDSFRDFVIKNVLVLISNEEFKLDDKDVGEMRCTISIYSFYEDCSEGFTNYFSDNLIHNYEYKNYFSYFVFSEIFNFCIRVAKRLAISDFNEGEASIVWYGRFMNFDCWSGRSDIMGFLEVRNINGFDRFLKELYDRLMEKIENAKKIVRQREGGHQVFESLLKRKS